MLVKQIRLVFALTVSSRRECSKEQKGNEPLAMQVSFRDPKMSHSFSTKFDKTCCWNKTAISANAICLYTTSKYFKKLPEAEEDGSGGSSTNTRLNVVSHEALEDTSCTDMRSGLSSATVSVLPIWDPRVSRPRAPDLGFSCRKRHSPSVSTHTGCPMNTRSSTKSSHR